ncbi:phosphoribosylaminoimidazolesuccinocarboxamide synthase [Guptibacillus hwajinpoensis]|uniref:Phosphoribosylaminoimidazole-succinocarboxamide synthase n=1 Tax=Guptibacillus hwajinpoensis TaxID=208199 RepID=A0A0J6CUI7_9BACL|nr:phosphoribosylaminoimidazolesuccinocarboxamide synthase [Alkalihalobacillus macyae]KMM35774.1 phosphoribosylaminoimidazole-succinocarboxamide synthase [Alkalihalobacillus macyae]
MEKQGLLYEGKAKRIYATDEAEVVWVEYKDSATAYNGEKKATISGKGRLNNEITSLLFDYLKSAGVESHFIEKLSSTEQLVKRVTIIPLEVVVRNIAAGSFSKRTGVDEGELLKQPIVEFYYKNDDLGDPLLTLDHVLELELATEETVNDLKERALYINTLLREYFLEREVKLVDFKLEFGMTAEGTIMLADEISPDTCRLWDSNTNEKLDKDVFRRDIGNLTEAYEQILARLGGSESCIK